MNLQNLVLYILVGIAFIAIVYFVWKTPKEDTSTREPKESKDK